MESRKGFPFCISRRVYHDVTSKHHHDHHSVLFTRHVFILFTGIMKLLCFVPSAARTAMAHSRPPDSGLPRGIPTGTIIFGPKGNCSLEFCPVKYSVYGYRPSFAANISFITLFAVGAVIHTYIGYRWKTWFFMGCIVLGCLSAISGYIGRVLMYYNPFNFSAFMLQIICVTSTPVYFTASIYVTLSQVITYFSPALSRCRPSLFYWVFIPADFVSLVIQAAGGALSVASKGTSQQGVDLALAGLAFQVFTICVFCGFMVDFMYRYFRRSSSEVKLDRRMYTFFGFLFLSILLITIRCTYRLAELHQGYRGAMVKDETLFIALEGVLVLGSVYTLMLGHPGLVFNKPEPEPNQEAVPLQTYKT